MAAHVFVANEVATATNLNSLLPPFATQAGLTTVVPVANTATSVQVTFPKPFISTPRVLVTAQTVVPGSQVKIVWVDSVTTTGFRAWIERSNTTKTTIAWQAYGASVGLFQTSGFAYASLLGAASAATMFPQNGLVTITTVANTPTSATVTFPTAFASVPVVVTVANTTAPGTVVVNTSAANITTTQATIYIYRTTAFATPVNWIALGRL